MNCWAMEAKNVPAVYFPQLSLYASLNAGGINSKHVRTVLAEHFGDDQSQFQILAKNGKTVVKKETKLPDMLLWSWVPIFSRKAKELITSLGSDGSEWMQCIVEPNTKDQYYLHLPAREIDSVDLENSQFCGHLSDGSSSLPIGILKLVLLSTFSDQIPPCFRVGVPGHEQVFAELIATGALRDEWIRNHLSGAEFRQLNADLGR